MYSASRCLKVFNICEDLFTYSKNLLVVQVLIGNTLATTLSHMLKKLEIALCPEAGNGTVSTVPQVLTVFWTHHSKIKIHGRKPIFLQETYMWNYSSFLLWTIAEILNGHHVEWGITTGCCSMSMCTDGIAQAKVFSLPRALHRPSCWSREFTVKQNLSSLVSHTPPELTLQGISIQQSF